MQSTFVDFELQFRSLVKRTNIKNKRGNVEKSAYNSGLIRKRKRRKSSQLAETGRKLLQQTDFFSDYGKPKEPEQRLSLRDLEEKRLTLPYIDTIEFVRLQLERRGINSREKTKTKQPETIIMEEFDDDFDMDLSEFMDPLSRSNIRRRKQQRVSKKKKNNSHAHDNNNDNDDTNIIEAATFSQIVTRARFPIFTDFLGLKKV
jgi:hypothetical protein